MFVLHYRKEPGVAVCGKKQFASNGRIQGNFASSEKLEQVNCSRCIKITEKACATT